VLLTDLVELAVEQAEAVGVALPTGERERLEEALGEALVLMEGVEVPLPVAVLLADTLPLRWLLALEAREALRVALLQREAVGRTLVVEGVADLELGSVAVEVLTAERVMLLVGLAEALPPRPPYPGPGLPVRLGLELPDSLVVELALKTSEAREVALGEVVPEVVEEMEVLALGQPEKLGLALALNTPVEVPVTVLRCTSLGVAVSVPVAVGVSMPTVRVGACRVEEGLRVGLWALGVEEALSEAAAR
jgi:hypothetical protein